MRVHFSVPTQHLHKSMTKFSLVPNFGVPTLYRACKKKLGNTCRYDLQRVGVYTSTLAPVQDLFSKMGVGVYHKVGIYPILYGSCCITVTDNFWVNAPSPCKISALQMGGC